MKKRLADLRYPPLIFNVVSITLFAVFFAFHINKFHDLLILCFTFIIFITCIFVVGEYFYNKNSFNIKLFFHNRNNFSFIRLFYKAIAFLFCIIMCICIYLIFPIFLTNSSYYFLKFAHLLSLPILVIAVIYIITVDSFHEYPKDDYYQLGRFICGKVNSAYFKQIRILLLSWLIRAFFTPIMLVAFIKNFEQIYLTDFKLIPDNYLFLYFFINKILNASDALFACVAYFVSLKIVKSEYKSVDLSIFAWIAALICYPPFNKLLTRIVYVNETNWIIITNNYPLMKLLFAIIILLLLSIFTLSTLNLGLRFSNLSNRGIVSKGLYSLTKHPAYVSKNIMWWLMTLPFITLNNDILLKIKLCFMTFLINLIYYYRAKTEEKHLSQDEDYTRYALKMNEKSIFAPLAKILPFLKYKSPKN